MIEAKFRPLVVSPGRSLFLQLACTSNCDKTVKVTRVDQPQHGSMIVFVENDKSAINCARLIIEESPSVVSETGPATAIEWR